MTCEQCKRRKSPSGANRSQDQAVLGVRRQANANTEARGERRHHAANRAPPVLHCKLDKNKGNSLKTPQEGDWRTPHAIRAVFAHSNSVSSHVQSTTRRNDGSAAGHSRGECPGVHNPYKPPLASPTGSHCMLKGPRRENGPKITVNRVLRADEEKWRAHRIQVVGLAGSV